jgi:hypothetical protein
VRYFGIEVDDALLLSEQTDPEARRATAVLVPTFSQWQDEVEVYRRLPDETDEAKAFYDAGCASGIIHLPFRISARGR